jgi:ABC-type transport system involved in cytochrome c biogenesis permease subunit
MTFFEGLLLAAASAMYLASFLLARTGRLTQGFATIVAALVMHLGSAVIRWIGVGHPAVFGTYEATLAASWFLLLFVALSFRSVYGQFRLLTLTLVPIALLLLLYGIVFFSTERIPLTISERSLWVDFHALFSWLVFAPFTLAFCLSGYCLWSAENNGAGVPNAPVDQSAPDANRQEPQSPNSQSGLIDELAFRYITFGFFNHSVMFALGSYYSSILFGAWWRWDPAFSIALMAWLLVGAYIHLRLFYNWNGRRAARFYFAVFAAIGFSYWGLAYLPAGQTFHVFDLDVRAL